MLLQVSAGQGLRRVTPLAEMVHQKNVWDAGSKPAMYCHTKLVLEEKWLISCTLYNMVDCKKIMLQINEMNCSPHMHCEL